MTIVNDNSRVVNKLEASVTDNARVIIYDRHMFIVPKTGINQHTSEGVCRQTPLNRMEENQLKTER